MNPNTWLLFLAAVTLLSLTPGPNGLIAITHGARYGAGAACFTIAGGVSGFVLLMGLSMIGLGGLLMASSSGFLILKVLGAGYLIYLGIKQWRSAPLQLSVTYTDQSVPSIRSLFLQGFYVAIANPKVILFFLAFLPQFLDASLWLPGQFVVMALTFGIVEFLVELALAIGARKIMHWFKGHRGAMLFNKLTGGLFVAAGAVLAVSQR
ncbi:LysE family translocator [Motiliproteus sp. MSK22-1]|uniref:LysE family translocator n=1 Tax=Motiliproteus sp. MSK22-1 TaxID=1897630 RepID=UPI000976BCAF|nr:LysE family translocator [Motiliproteus sp. MSK22-1]OMH32760.1 hypothetical protein BGP75_14645 [Motiliproteus sp. MSK22-1]